MTAKTPKQRRGKRLVTPQEWEDEALRVMAEQGIDGVKIDRMTRRMGVSRGSFYWHFENREALLLSALRRWETVSTTEVLALLRRSPEPQVRLVRLFKAAYADRANGRLFAALSRANQEPIIQETLERITTTRMAFLEECYTMLGYAPLEATHWATMAYSAYVGLYALIGSLPEDDPRFTRDRLRTYLDFLIESLLAPEHRTALRS